MLLLTYDSREIIKLKEGSSRLESFLVMFKFSSSYTREGLNSFVRISNGRRKWVRNGCMVRRE